MQWRPGLENGPTQATSGAQYEKADRSRSRPCSKWTAPGLHSIHHPRRPWRHERPGTRDDGSSDAEPHGAREPERAAQQRQMRLGFRVTMAGTHRWFPRDVATRMRTRRRAGFFRMSTVASFGGLVLFGAVLLDRTSTSHGSVMFGLDHSKRIGPFVYSDGSVVLIHKKKRDSEDSYPILAPCGRFRTLCAAIKQRSGRGPVNAQSF
jgi:hypothetical protein